MAFRDFLVQELAFQTRNDFLALYHLIQGDAPDYLL
jgi:hypothetical protein